MSLSTSTLRDYLEQGYVIRAHCSNYFRCYHSGKPSLMSLVQRLGWDFNIVQRRTQLQRILYCSVCGRYYPDLIVARLDPPDTFSRSHAGFGPVCSVLEVAPLPKSESNVEYDKVAPKGRRRRRFGRR